MNTLRRQVSAPHGASITCKGWPHEAARGWEAFIVETLRRDGGYPEAVATAARADIDMPMKTPGGARR